MKTKQKGKAETKKSIINNGLMQYLLAFRLCEPKDVEKCVRRLNESALVISEITKEFTMDIKQGFYKSANKAFDSKFFDAMDKAEKSDIDLSKIVSIPGIHEIEPNSSYGGINFRIGNQIAFDTESFLNAMLTDMNANMASHAYEASSRVYMLLPPIPVTYKNKNSILFNNLTIFPNGMAIIKIEYSINDTEIDELSANLLSSKYDSVHLPLCCSGDNDDSFEYFESDNEKSESDVGNRLFNAVHNIINVKFNDKPDYINYYILFLNEYSSKTESPNSNHQYTKDVLRLLAAPMFDYNYPSQDRAKNMLNEAHYELTKYNHLYVSTVGRAIAVSIGDNTQDIIKILGGITVDEAKNISTTSFVHGITPAVESVLLKTFIKMSIFSRCLDVSKKSLKELLEIKSEIHNLTIQESLSFAFKYGTMGEMTSFIDKRYEYFVTNERIDKMIDNFNEVVTTKELINRSRASNLFSLLGVVLSLFLSFTGIREIIKFVNNAYGIFDSTDYHTKLIVSSTVWLIVVAIVVLTYLWYRVKKK